MHTDYSTTSKCNTNAQLWDFNAIAWVIDIPVQYMKLAFLKAPLHAKASTPWPASQTKCYICSTPPVTNNDALFDAAESAPFFSSANATLNGCNSSPATPTLFRNSFNTLSLTLEDEEDNIKDLMTFSSSPTIAAPSHVSDKPQCIKKASEVQDISFQAQDICYTYQETISQCWNKIWPFLHGETVVSHGQCKWHGFQFLPQEK